MWYDVIVLCVAIIISAIANSEMDSIQFKPSQCWFPNSIWWSTLNYKDRSWLIKYPLSMLGDGWHLCKFIMLYSLFTGIGLVLQNHYPGVYIWIWFPLGVYCLNGLVFNLSYDNNTDFIIKDK